MKLYEFGPTRSLRARWTLQEIGCPFESVRVDLMAAGNQEPEFMAVNPAAKLPVLVDGDQVLTESVAIVLYLAEKFPEANLLPENPVAKAQVYRWLLFTATEIEQPLWRMARHTFLYPEEKRIPEDIERAREDVQPMIEVLDRHMQGRSYVAGDAVTVADFVLAHTLDWANGEKLLESHPTLREYMERMYRRPKATPRIAVAFEAALAEHNASTAQ